MKRQVIALMDSDESYAVRFMDYVNHRKNTPFEVRAFTDYGQMKQWISEHYAEILLISEDDFRKEDREIAGRAGVTVRLTGGPGGSGDQEPCICKYQAASAVLKEAAVQEVTNREEIAEETSPDGDKDAASGELCKAHEHRSALPDL